MDTYTTEKTLSIERKHFTVSLGGNERGGFLRVTEFSNGFSNNIVIPIDGVAELMGVMAEVLKSGNKKIGLPKKS